MGKDCSDECQPGGPADELSEDKCWGGCRGTAGEGVGEHVGERHGRALVEPQALADAQPGVVIVMSRGFAQEIADEAKALAPNAEIIFYSDLMARARLAA